MTKKILTLDNIPVIKKNIGRIDTIEKLKASTIYSLGDVVEVLGYYTKGDGSHHYRQKVDGSYTGKDAIIGVDGSVWGLILQENKINLKWLGCKNDDELSQYFTKVQGISSLFSDSWLGYTIEIPRGSYTFTNQVDWEQTRVINIVGEGEEQSVFIDFRGLPTNSYAFYFKPVTPINYRLPHFSIRNIVANGYDCNAGFVKTERSIFSVFENIWLQGFKPLTSKVFSMTNDSHFFRFDRIKILGCSNVFGFNISEAHKITNCWFDTCEGIDFRGTNGTIVENTDFETGNKNIYTGDRNRFKIHFERNGSTGGTNNGETLINVGSDTELDFNCALDGGTQHYPIKFLGEGATVKLSGRALKFVEPSMPSWSETNNITLRDLALFTNGLEEVTFKNIETKRNKLIIEGNATNMITTGSVTFEKDYVSDGVKGIRISNTTGASQTYKVSLEIPSCQNIAFSSILFKNLAGSSNKTITLFFGDRNVAVSKSFFKEYMLSVSDSLSFGNVTKIEFTETIENGNARFIKYPIITEDISLARTFNTGSVVSSLQSLDTPYHATQMSKLGILDNYHNYLSELHEYEKSQNVQSDSEIMALNVLQPPVIPTEVEEYAKEYNLI